ncbi:PPIL6 protein, partial [Eudromia elegans]|nr:PPIL6 protein [Eudromia elegans]
MGPPAPPERLEVVGLLREPAFHVAKGTAEALKLKFPREFADPVVRPMFEFAWHEYLQEKKKDLLFCFGQHVFVYLDVTIEEQPVGRLLFEVCHTGGKPRANRASASPGAAIVFRRGGTETRPLVVHISFLSLVLQLFSDTCPKTCENFRALCTGGITSPSSGLHLTYKNSVFHRVVKNGWIQGGGASGRGDGGESIYGPTFEDENFAIRHSKRGILGMANKGRHSNGSQFYITLQAAPYLDKKHVAFGQVIEGTETLQKLEAVSTYNERPVEECKIIDCGVFEP